MRWQEVRVLYGCKILKWIRRQANGGPVHDAIAILPYSQRIHSWYNEWHKNFTQGIIRWNFPKGKLMALISRFWTPLYFSLRFYNVNSRCGDPQIGFTDLQRTHPPVLDFFFKKSNYDRLDIKIVKQGGYKSEIFLSKLIDTLIFLRQLSGWKMEPYNLQQSDNRSTTFHL